MKLHHYQVRAAEHTVAHDNAMLWLDMGLGKTVITLTAIRFRMAMGQVSKTLIVAPLRVCQTVWKQEAQLWTHTQGLKFAYVIGSEKHRLRGLFSNADIYLVNYENLAWLSEQLRHYYSPFTLPFNMLVWDEVSKMKHSTSARGVAFRSILPWFQYKVGLTGTPCSNGLVDLHGQYLVVDGGERLTPRITHFKERWFFKEAYTGRTIPHHNAQQQIEDQIHDITLQMRAEDYLDVPDFNVNDVYIKLPESLKSTYAQLETDMFIELDGVEITVFSAAALSMKCLQFANGNLYPSPDSSQYVKAHSLKLQALAEIIEGTGDAPILLAYLFRSDVAEIMKAYPKAVNLSGLHGQALEKAVNDWNAGKIKLLLGHPLSMGHGMNLQHGGHHIVWYGLPWALDLYEQLNARLHRQGQPHPVFCHRILIQDTVEEAVLDALESKAETQEELRSAIGRYRQASASRT